MNTSVYFIFILLVKSTYCSWYNLKTDVVLSQKILASASQPIETKSATECTLRCRRQSKNSFIKDGRQCYCVDETLQIADEEIEDGQEKAVLFTLLPTKAKPSAFWEQLTSQPTCYGAKDNTRASFTLRRNGLVKSLKLVHVSGYINCYLDDYYRGYWGCRAYPTFQTFITNNRREPIFPSRMDTLFDYYLLPGYTLHSDEIILPISYQGQKDEVLEIWYGEDYLNIYLADNIGKHCVSVYAWYD